MKYYFDIRNGTVDIDDVGVELLDMAAAISEAKRTLASLASEAILSDENQISVDIRDSERVICTATMTIDLRRPY